MASDSQGFEAFFIVRMPLPERRQSSPVPKFAQRQSWPRPQSPSREANHAFVLPRIYCNNPEPAGIDLHVISYRHPSGLAAARAGTKRLAGPHALAPWALGVDRHSAGFHSGHILAAVAPASRGPARPKG
jgi:hypothetical protein